MATNYVEVFGMGDKEIYCKDKEARQFISDLENTVTENKKECSTKIETLTETVNSNKQDCNNKITSLENTVTSLENTVTSNKQQVDNNISLINDKIAANKKDIVDATTYDCIILGNSWVTGGSRAEGIAGGWGNYFSKYYKKGNIFNGAVSGEGIVDGYYARQLDNVMKKNDTSNVKLIIISGCINNRNTPSEVLPHLNQLIDKIRGSFPKAKIVFVSPDCSTATDKMNGNLAVNANIDASCQTKGVKCFFLQGVVMCRRGDFIGDYHINESLAERLASIINFCCESGEPFIRVVGNGNSYSDYKGDCIYTNMPCTETISGTGKFYDLPGDIFPVGASSGVALPINIFFDGGGWDTGYLIGTEFYYYGSKTGKVKSLRFFWPSYQFIFN